MTDLAKLRRDFETALLKAKNNSVEQQSLQPIEELLTEQRGKKNGVNRMPYSDPEDRAEGYANDYADFLYDHYTQTVIDCEIALESLKGTGIGGVGRGEIVNGDGSKIGEGGEVSGEKTSKYGFHDNTDLRDLEDGDFSLLRDVDDPIELWTLWLSEKRYLTHNITKKSWCGTENALEINLLCCAAGYSFQRLCLAILRNKDVNGNGLFARDILVAMINQLEPGDDFSANHKKVISRHTVLTKACREGWFAVVQEILRVAAMVNAPDGTHVSGYVNLDCLSLTRDSNGSKERETPLMLACRHGIVSGIYQQRSGNTITVNDATYEYCSHAKIVESLLNFAIERDYLLGVNKKSETDGKTALMKASLSGKVEIVELLLDFNNLYNVDRRVRIKGNEMMDQYQSYGFVDVNLQDNNENTALMCLMRRAMMTRQPNAEDEVEREKQLAMVSTLVGNRRGERSVLGVVFPGGERRDESYTTNNIIDVDGLNNKDGQTAVDIAKMVTYDVLREQILEALVDRNSVEGI